MGKKSKAPSAAKAPSGNTTKSYETKNEGIDAAGGPVILLDSSIPTEMSQDEYQDLLTQIAELTLEEAQEEWMESCRYGEIDVIRALASSAKFFKDVVDGEDQESAPPSSSPPCAAPSTQLVRFVQPTSGNTGLHMAAANNHVAVVQLLLEALRHPFVANSSGNTPLHWASANGHGETVQYLTNQTIVEIDVLQKNGAGRSALTEGFTSQKEAVVKALLEHDSATEEKLLSTGTPVDVEDDDGRGDNEEKTNDDATTTAASHVHHLFDPEYPLLIRELAMKNADNPFADADRPDQDTTGLSIWSASLVAARWMRDLMQQGRIGNITSARTQGDVDTTDTETRWTALELGSGCGVPGLALAAAAMKSSSSSPSSAAPLKDEHNLHAKIFVTDLNPQTVKNLQHNVELNRLTDTVEALVMDWDDRSTWPTKTGSTNSYSQTDGADEPPQTALCDVVLGSDLIYQKALVPLLKSVILGTVKPGGTFLYVAPDTGRDGMDEFLQEMKALCPGWTERVAPPEYIANPLTNGDGEECFLHFQELHQSTYMLYEFPIQNAQ